MATDSCNSFDHQPNGYRNTHMKTHTDGFEDSVEGDLLVGRKRNSITPSEQRYV
jgi:hypothetical protein